MPEFVEKKHLEVDFEPVGRRAEILSGHNLLEAAQNAGVDLVSVCGGDGSCDSCRVRLMAGQLTPHTSEEKALFNQEELDQGYRLACQAVPQADVKIEIPPESLATTQRLQLEGQDFEFSGADTVIACDIEVDPATMEDLRSDSDRLRDVLAQSGHKLVQFSPQVQLTISEVLRDNGWRVRAAIRNGRVVALLPERTQLLGLAVDVGTTKVAAYLMDLETGKTLAKIGVMNPQISYGEDVISRIAYCDKHEEGRVELQTKLIDALNGMVAELCAESSIDPEQIVEAVIVGNTAMHHLLIGLSVHQLALAPYVPAVGEAMNLSAADLGLAIASGALIYLPPNIAGFVGADHVAMVLSTDVWKTQETVLALDIGTNTEITLAHKGRLLSCSCASGPAFEGAHLHDGMRAAPGAIERVQIIDGKPKVFTIGGQDPIGICGSGILDTVAELIMNGIVNQRGSLQAGDPRVRYDKRTKHQEYVLVPADESGHGRDVVVTRSDVNEIQLAKGAIRAGLEILLEEMEISAGKIDAFVVAGAFGTYLDVDSAVIVGMFPDLPRECFRQVGNAAGLGARQMLMLAERRAAADEIRSRVEYIELTTHAGFENAFMTALYFQDPDV